jgi:hypothetical protein
MDADQTAAIYCRNGGVNVSRIILSKGYPSLSVSKATIDKVPKLPAQNTLTSGEQQINATSFEDNPDYVFIWNECESSG